MIFIIYEIQNTAENIIISCQKKSIQQTIQLKVHLADIEGRWWRRVC